MVHLCPADIQRQPDLQGSFDLPQKLWMAQGFLSGDAREFIGKEGSA